MSLGKKALRAIIVADCLISSALFVEAIVMIVIQAIVGFSPFMMAVAISELAGSVIYMLATYRYAGRLDVLQRGPHAKA